MEKQKIMLDLGDGKEADLREILAESTVEQMKEMGFNFGEDGKVKLSALPAEVKSEAEKKAAEVEEGVNYLKAQIIPEKHYKQYGVKATPVNTGDDSFGAAVPTTVSNAVLEAKRRFSVLADRAFSFTLAGNYVLPTEGEGVTAYWMESELDEGDANLIPESEPTLGKDSLEDNYLAARVSISWKLMNASAFDIQRYIANLMGRALAEEEEKAFIGGDGDHKPKGIRTEDLESVAQLGETTTRADLMNLWFKLPAGYRQNAIFLTADGGAVTVNNIVDENGRTIFPTDTPLDSIWNRPFLSSNNVPENLGGGSETEILFGDPGFYWIKYGTGLTLETQKVIERMKTMLVMYQAVDGKLVDKKAFVKLTGVNIIGSGS